MFNLFAKKPFKVTAIKGSDQYQVVDTENANILFMGSKASCETFIKQRMELV